MCGAAGLVLRRIMRRRSGTHGLSVGETLTTQRAEVGCCPCCSPAIHVAMPGSCPIGARSAYKDVVMQPRQARGPWRSRRVPAFQYVSTSGCLPKDWDWAASALSIDYPPLPYLARSPLGGICDVQTGGLPPLRRTAPDFADAPVAPLGAAPVVVRDDIRAPPACAKLPPPIFHPTAPPLSGGCTPNGRHLGLSI